MQAIERSGFATWTRHGPSRRLRSKRSSPPSRRENQVQSVSGPFPFLVPLQPKQANDQRGHWGRWVWCYATAVRSAAACRPDRLPGPPIPNRSPDAAVAEARRARYSPASGWTPTRGDPLAAAKAEPAREGPPSPHYPGAGAISLIPGAGAPKTVSSGADGPGSMTGNSIVVGDPAGCPVMVGGDTQVLAADTSMQPSLHRPSRSGASTAPQRTRSN
jgi:hypothetical protein